jgi:hypothetical protein
MPASLAPRLLTGIYPLLLALMAGGILVDMLYGRSAPAGAADALLLLVLPVLVAGVLAATLAAGRARRLFLLSLAIFSLEFLLPALAAALPGGAATLAGAGPLLRIGIQLAAMLFAFLGFLDSVRSAIPARKES